MFTRKIKRSLLALAISECHRHSSFRISRGRSRETYSRQAQEQEQSRQDTSPFGDEPEFSSWAPRKEEPQGLLEET